MDTLVKTLEGEHGNVTASVDDVNHAVIRYLHLPIASAATGTFQHLALEAQTGITLLSAYISPGAALTANDTNYRTLQLGVSSTLAGTITALDSFNTKITGGTGDWVARTAESFTIAPSTDVLTKGQFLWLSNTPAASGVAIPEGSVLVVKYSLTA